MISFQQAKDLINQIPFSCQIESRETGDCLGKLLAKDVHSTVDLPLWNNSAMDGYAYCAKDISTAEPLTIAFKIAAGHPVKTPLPKGQCARIMTGAPMPIGADSVIIQENTTPVATNRVRFTKIPEPGANVRTKGEELPKGSLILNQGTKLCSRHLSLAVNAGVQQLPVVVSPNVGIISTGDELNAPGEALEYGQIWSTNTISMILALQEFGVKGQDFGIAKDNLESTKKCFLNALNSCDIIISSGGVSVGDFDVVKKALDAFDIDMQFWKVKMKPGKPIAFGTINAKPIFALPGNPVSCFVSFYQFVRPFILKSMGASQPEMINVRATLMEEIHKKHSRLEFVRMRMVETENGLGVVSTGGQSSAWLSSLANAQALLPMAPECHSLKKGSTVTVQLLPY